MSLVSAASRHQHEHRLVCVVEYTDPVGLVQCHQHAVLTRVAAHMLLQVVCACTRLLAISCGR